jgi:hypothetical protein
MQRRSSSILSAATIILAAITAALPSWPIRRDIDEYFASESSPGWEETALVVGANMSEDPAPMDWRLRTGPHAWSGGKPLERRAPAVPASAAEQQQGRQQDGT